LLNAWSERHRNHPIREEQVALEQLVRWHTTPQQIALRARIILAAEQGQTNSAIHAEQGVAVNTMRSWCKRWVALQAIALAKLECGRAFG
jgi:putative transposase